jgi:hypothetical protein
MRAVRLGLAAGQLRGYSRLEGVTIRGGSIQAVAQGLEVALVTEVTRLFGMF